VKNEMIKATPKGTKGFTSTPDTGKIIAVSLLKANL